MLSRRGSLRSGKIVNHFLKNKQANKKQLGGRDGLDDDEEFAL